MASINSFFGKTKADGTFDLRISANRNRSDTVGGRVASNLIAGTIVSGSHLADKVFDEMHTSVLEAISPMVIDAVQDYVEFKRRFHPTKRVCEIIREIPSSTAEDEKFKLAKKTIDSEFLEAPDESVMGFLDSIYEDSQILQIELLIQQLKLCYWINFSELAVVSNDLEWAMVSPIEKLRNIRSNYRLTKNIMSYYNERADNLFKELKALLANLNLDHKDKCTIAQATSYALSLKKLRTARWHILNKFNPKVLYTIILDAQVKITSFKQKLVK